MKRKYALIHIQFQTKRGNLECTVIMYFWQIKVVNSICWCVSTSFFPISFFIDDNKISVRPNSTYTYTF